MKLSAASALALIGAVSAQQTAYGQCGGVSWTGATTCVSGYVCTYQNAYYSQCIPGTASSTTSKAATTTTTTSKAASSTTTSKASSSTTLTSSVKSSTTTTIKASSTTSTVSTATGFAHAVGTKFNIDGVTHYVAGTNSYWIGFLTNDADVDLVMSHLQTSGLKILRVWGFNDVSATPSAGTVWYQSLIPGASPVINTGANGLERLDYVVSSAEAHDIKLIINFVNNWSDYGGIPAYINYYGGTQQEWYTNAAAQAQYQTYIKAVVSRYTTSSAIFAWELANESRCNGCNTSVIYNWASTTSAYIKSLDSAHMVTLGDEGFNPSAGDGSYPYTTGEGVSFVQNLAIKTLDFGTFHMYPTSWSVDPVAFPPGWISAHGAACVAANKPCLLEEYGITYDHVEYEEPWQQDALATAGIAGDMFWQLGDTLSTGETSDDGNTIYYGSTDWATLVTAHVAAINAE